MENDAVMKRRQKEEGAIQHTTVHTKAVRKPRRREGREKGRRDRQRPTHGEITTQNNNRIGGGGTLLTVPTGCHFTADSKLKALEQNKGGEEEGGVTGLNCKA